MLVFINTAYQPPASAVPEFHRHARRDRIGIQQITDSPEKADVILFVDARADQNDWPMRKMRDHALTRKFPEKTFVFCEMDQPWYGMPGLYTSMPKPDFIRNRQRSCGYHIVVVGESMAGKTPSFGGPKLLFSFVGRSLPGAREAGLKLKHPRALIEDTPKFNFFTDDANAQLAEQKTKYQNVILNSKFVLCPAGAGPASIRQFETFGAGRVPVIISDEWVEVDGPDWDACSIRVAEKDVPDVPALLEAREQDWPAMVAGNAVLASRVGGVPEVVLDGETGMLVPAEDVLALARALGELAGDAARCDRLGAAGRRRVEARYGWPAVVDDYLAVYARALGRSQNPGEDP